MTFERNPPEGEGDAFPAGAKAPLEKRFAALTAGLLARKGEAEPAMDVFNHARIDPVSARQMEPGARHEINRQPAGEGHAAQIDPISDSNDVREEWRRVKPAAPAQTKAVIEDAPRMPPKNPARAPDSQTELPQPQKEFAENCPRQKIAISAKRAAVTFRMSVHDFLRLKLASAELEVPSQDIILSALDSYLDVKGVERLDNCRCLREAARACGDTSAEDA